MLKHLLLFIAISLLSNINTFSQNVNVHYLGHSAFVLSFDDIAVVADYGKPNAWKQWGWDSPIYDIGKLMPDVMTYSHLHEDHYDSTRIPMGVKYILKNGKELEIDGLKISAIPTCENSFGTFDNTSYLFSYKGFNILHTGDIQGMIANIENDTVAKYFKKNYPENIDLLIMPIEGKIKYISQAEKFIRLLRPKRIIPSHSWSQEYLDEFIAYMKSLNNSGLVYSIHENESSKFIVEEKTTPDTINIIILEKSVYK